MEEVCGPQERPCRNINHIWSNVDHCIIISLWTFQPTLVSVRSLGLCPPTPRDTPPPPPPPLPNPAGTNTARHQMMSSAISTNEAERWFLPHTGHSDYRLHTIRPMVLQWLTSCLKIKRKWNDMPPKCGLNVCSERRIIILLCCGLQTHC